MTMWIIFGQNLNGNELFSQSFWSNAIFDSDYAIIILKKQIPYFEIDGKNLFARCFDVINVLDLKNIKRSGLHWLQFNHHAADQEKSGPKSGPWFGLFKIPDHVPGQIKSRTKNSDRRSGRPCCGDSVCLDKSSTDDLVEAIACSMVSAVERLSWKNHKSVLAWGN